MTATALAALDAPHEVLDDERIALATQELEEFLDKLGSVPREEADATARRLMGEWDERLRAIPDVISRAVVAESLVKVIDARSKRDRAVRDIAVAIMLRPWSTLQKEFKAEKEALDRKRDSGEISPEEYIAAEKDYLARKLHAERRQHWAPTPACTHAWISRGLYFSRIRPRQPSPRPEMPMERAEREAERAGRVVKFIDGAVAQSAKRGRPVLRDVIEAIRNESIDVMLTSPQDGGLGIANADVHRLLDMTTARIAQLRGIQR
jgi:hypothetical protein